MKTWGVIVVALVSCKKSAPPAANGSGSAGSGSGSAVVAVVAVDAGSAVEVDAPAVDATAVASGDAKGLETFGGISLGTKADKVIELLGKPEKTEDEYEEGASGLWIGPWKWPGKGVELDMAADKKGAPFTVHSITLTPPSTLKNPSGIGVGSPRADVEKAFGSAIDQAESKGDSILVGSVYGGVYFDLAAGKVTKVFVGAGAE